MGSARVLYARIEKYITQPPSLLTVLPAGQLRK